MDPDLKLYDVRAISGRDSCHEKVDSGQGILISQSRDNWIKSNQWSNSVFIYQVYDKHIIGFYQLRSTEQRDADFSYRHVKNWFAPAFGPRGALLK